jgi:hypothetical protein
VGGNRNSKTCPGARPPGSCCILKYKLAILEQHKGNSAEFLTLLQEALDHGLSPDECLGIETDPDLKSLHGDPRFTVLIVESKKRAAAALKN